MNTRSPETKFATLSTAMLALAAVCFSVTGCSMCCGTYDYHYPTFGGRLPRANPEYGRVGSVFSDPYAAAIGPSADSNLQPVEFIEPTSIDDDPDDLDPSEFDDPLDGLDDPLEGLNDPVDGIDEIDGIDTSPEPTPNTNPIPGPEDITPRETTPTDASASNNEARRWRNRPLRRPQQRWR